jgi:hypothetical protein
MKKILLAVLLAAILAPLAGCIVYERPYDDAYSSGRPYDDAQSYRQPYPYPSRPYPYRSYPYRYDSPYRYRRGY